MTVAQLSAARDAAVSVAAKPGVHVFDDFVIFNDMGNRSRPSYYAYRLWSCTRNRVVRL